jgi:two-component system nitrate/nitrite response regulator NarL
MIRVAIAEDHKSLIDGIDVFFKFEKDITIVFTTNDGETLMNFLKNRHKNINIVITDIRMPKLDGIEVTKQISNLYPHIKVIAFTMFGQQSAIKKMIDVGAKGYLMKNAGLATLLNAIRKVNQGETFYDPNISLEYETPTLSKQENLLTKRQNEVLELIGQGLSSKEIAEKMNRSKYTVEAHRKMITKKLGLKGRNALISYAINRKYDFE